MSTEPEFRCCVECGEEVGEKGFLDEEGLCRDCTDTHRCCDSCEELVPEEDVDDDGVCRDCLEETEHRRQLESDYRYWTAGM